MLFHRQNEYIGIVPAGIKLEGGLADGLMSASCVVTFGDHKDGVCVGKVGCLPEKQASFYSGNTFLVVWGDNDKDMAECLSNRPSRTIVYVGSNPPGPTSEAMLKEYDKNPLRNVYRFGTGPEALRVVAPLGKETVVQKYNGKKWVPLSAPKPKAATPKPPVATKKADKKEK